MNDDSIESIKGLRRRIARAHAVAIGALLVSGMTGANACLRGQARASAPDTEDSILRARGLVIVDEHGVERVVLGAPTPDPKGPGKRVAPLHGLVINGPDGEERGGYGVMGQSGEAILTLDGAAGDEVFKVVANPDAGASLFVIHQRGSTTALTTYRGEPELHLIAADGATVLSLPADTPPL